MVSKRKFFVIFLMMAILLLLFQSAQIMRENWNYYSNNEYASNLSISSDSVWTEDRDIREVDKVQSEILETKVRIHDSLGQILMMTRLYICPFSLNDDIMLIASHLVSGT